ncbi:MAG: DRTGG domain-containing protein [Caldicoprobacterales bacterium]|jgi:predicted transcriptional regulator|nr:CBS domain-containing protein [Clostridiales bacterium]
MTTKHDQIIQYIMNLEAGAAISVRKVARELGVSQGTAYRAIKEAENREYVKTFPRMGTIRVEQDKKRGIERLTFAEAAAMVDGTVLGGNRGLNKTLVRFVIGAMTPDAMEKYLSSGSLLIVGNREEAFRLALEHECAVLITGGFGCSDEIRQLADQKGLPVISSTYDTFTTATMINQAISERLIKKEILLVEDIMIEEPKYLYEDDSIGEWNNLLKKHGHSRFPVLNRDHEVVGVLTPKDIQEASTGLVRDFMSPKPLIVTQKTTVAYAAHIMAWEGYELLPVVESGRLIGVISRQDVIKAIQHMRNQPQMGETLDDVILSNFGSKRMEKRMRFTGKVTPLLASHMGTASWSALSMLMSTAALVTLKNFGQTDVSVDTFTVFFVHPVQLEDMLEIDVEPVEEGRVYNKVEICIYREKELVAKAMLAAKAMRK